MSQHRGIKAFSDSNVTSILCDKNIQLNGDLILTKGQVARYYFACDLTGGNSTIADGATIYIPTYSTVRASINNTYANNYVTLPMGTYKYSYSLIFGATTFGSIQTYLADVKNLTTATNFTNGISIVSNSTINSISTLTYFFYFTITNINNISLPRIIGTSNTITDLWTLVNGSVEIESI